MKIVQSKVRAAVKGFRMSPDFFEELDKKVDEMIKEASNRAKANNRKTLRAYDL